MSEHLRGRLVLDDGEVLGDLRVDDDGCIAAIEPDGTAPVGTIVLPGFIDVHVHGWGGHDAMGGPQALSGMARGLAARGVTAVVFLGLAGWFAHCTFVSGRGRGGEALEYAFLTIAWFWLLSLQKLNSKPSWP